MSRRAKAEAALRGERLKDLVREAVRRFLLEPAALDDFLEEMCIRDRSSPGFWSDAYLAAFARAGQYRFATFARGFRRFEGLDLLLLSG